MRDGFAVYRDTQWVGRLFPLVAHRSGFELTKLGNCENFFVFGELERPSLSELRAFSSLAFDFAMHAKSSNLPCGLFEMINCFAVCCVQSLEARTAETIRTSPPVKHRAAFELPVVYDSSQARLVYFEKTPIWGAAYYRKFRRQINKYLAEAEFAPGESSHVTTP